MNYPNAKMSDAEREAVRAPLAEALQKITPAVPEVVNILALPIALVTAFGAWGLRVASEAAVYHEQQMKEAQRANGFSGQPTSVTSKATPLHTSHVSPHVDPGGGIPITGVDEQPNFHLG